ncbi:MAG TPA: SbcC/MukB-like Walker B domain-containing protein [Streptosporangiaceae bacterium]|nr:SbcC/MukB-like Walker B domain-containing protein [Streptosporangiaceae bacterium]
MMTLEKLTSWRVAAIEGKLPDPVRSDRWQPLRAGVVNLWEYDTAEVWYADGRMQLQGANESGKSTLMTLTTLLLLAGEITSHNIDTLGQNDKRFRYYVEPTDHALDRRDTSSQKNRGWAWLEFGRAAHGDQGAGFFTLLLFAETRRADTNLTVNWCTLSGQTRVRFGLSLTMAGFVADPARFREVPGFLAHPTGTAYRETIARVLYDTDEVWLNQLNRILRVVRTPQIGHKIDLKFLMQAFRTALPPIAQDEVNQLADGWEQLQRLRDERDEADQALAAVTEFSRRSWRPWADAVIRAAADPVTTAATALTQITRAESAAREAVKTLTKQQGDLNDQRGQAETTQRTASAERNALQEQDAYRDAISALANARLLAEQASEAEKAAGRSQQRAREAQAKVFPAQQRLEQASHNLESAERSVLTAADQVSAQAPEAGLVDLTAQRLPERDTARLRQAARLRESVARQADKLIEAHATALGKADAAATEAAAARTRLGEAERTAAEKDTAVETAVTATAQTLSAWIQHIDERIRPTAETAENWGSLVAGLAEAMSPSPVLAMAISRDHLIPIRRPYEKRKAELETAIEDNVRDRNGLQAELSQVEKEQDPIPCDPEFWTRRQRPEGVTAAGAPFWRLVETSDRAPVAAIEAALDAAGLLQSWVTPDAAYLTSRDGNETVWAAEASTVPVASSLRTVLHPTDDAGDLTGVVDRLLRRVAYGEQALTNPVAVSPDGRWRHGELAGTAAPLPESPKLLGAAARAADRVRRAERIRNRISGLADDHELMSLELDDVVGLLGALDDAGEGLPSDGDVVAAVLAAREAAKQVAKLQTEAEGTGRIADDARKTADATAAAVAVHCDEHDLPRIRLAVAHVLTALSEYLSAITALEDKMSLIEPLRGAATQAEEALNGLMEAAVTAAADAEEDMTTAGTLQAKADAASKALSKGAQEILREVNRLGRVVDDARQTLERLGKELLNLAGKLSRAETVLEETEGKREKAEEERGTAAQRWWDCVDSGLPLLRSVPEPLARHVTAALENARAAKAMISPRNWPDSDQQHLFPQVVQNRWASMVSDSSELRPKLELLGGRSVQVSSPGEGREDFPGGVKFIVDSTGSAFAPPRAAERLSALLEQLRADYDDELTRTIDELLGSTFIEHLRDRLAEAEVLREDINKKLAHNPVAISGITLRLRRIPLTEERAANDVLDTLEQHFNMLPKPSQNRIRAFLAERITNAQEAARTSGDPNWRSRLAEILDYRRWFELRLEYRTPRSEWGDRSGGGWRSLERGDHGLLSGGAKVVTLMQPFIAALHAMYDQAGSGPRMLWLDEAFGGVDGTNKASMFRLLTSCDLDWLIAGPNITANSAAVPMAAIYEVRRAPQPLPGVSLELAVWAGNELTHVMAPDPADLKDMAARDAADEDNDALF